MRFVRRASLRAMARLRTLERGMGDLVSFHDDIDTLGHEFALAATHLRDAVTQLRKANDHVRHAFDNHPDHAATAIAPFAKLNHLLGQLQKLVTDLGSTLCDSADGYRDNDTDVAKGWQRISTNPSDSYRG